MNNMVLSFSEHFGWFLAVAGSAVLAAAFPDLGIGFLVWLLPLV